jgi:hypothetical protein
VSRKTLIPRRDHEIYFIPFKGGLKEKERHAYIQENLGKLHPGFSDLSAYDLQKIILDKEPWLMATVMEQGALTEYRIANPHGSFFTATGLLIRQPGFTEKGPYNFPDERIGYDKSKKEPFSLPVGGAGETVQGNAAIAALLKKAPGGYRVFREKGSRLPLLIICASAAISAIGLLSASLGKTAIETEGETMPVEAIQKENMPGPFEVFASIAYLLYKNGGIILQWQYDQMQNPAFVISLEGIEPNSLPALFGALSYVNFNSISDIQYSGNTPQYTLNLSVNASQYITPSYRNMDNQENIFPILGSFHSGLAAYHVSFLTEALPAERNGFDSCNMSISCPSNNFVPVMETIEAILSRHRMGITRMSLALNKSDSAFSFSYSFSPYSPDYSREAVFSPESYSEVLAAFGHTPKTPERQSAAKNIDDSNLTKIGLIKDEDGLTSMFYRDNRAGKIIVK